MKHKNPNAFILIRRWLSVSILCLFITGCSLGKYGAEEPGYFTISVPADLIGKSKTEIANRLGIPEEVCTAGQSEYWRYYDKSGWWFWIILVLPAFGVTQAKSLVLEFHDDKVAYSYLWDRGFALGVHNIPGAVAN